MLHHFISKIPEWIRNLPKKARPFRLVIVGLVVFSLITGLIYALPVNDNDDYTLEPGILDSSIRNSIPLRNTNKEELSFRITDPTGKSSNPKTALSNQFNHANQNKFSTLGPGDKLDLGYEITNTGTKALDIRETYYILSLHPQSTPDLDFAMFYNVSPDETGSAYIGSSPLASNKLDNRGRLYSFTTEPYTLSGSDDKIDGAPKKQENNRYMVFNRFAGNQTQGETILIIITLEYKDHSSDEWEPSITDTVIVGGATASMEYRTGTHVYISCDVVALDYVNPENPAYVTFTITDQNGDTTTHTFDGFDSPPIGIQRAYVPFLIPNDIGTGEITVTISSSENVLCDTKEIVATVVSSEERTPPDPTMDTVIPISTSLPRFKGEDAHEWVTYSASKNADGKWIYEEHVHSATLSTQFTLKPDGNVETAVGNTLASGYGVNAEVKSKITTDGPVYNVQNVYCFFPEFSYKDYSRKLQTLSQDGLTAIWEFRPNEYSHSNSKAHYIPPAYPDGLYTVFAIVRDAWTPVGELKGSVTAEVNISGSLYDDWYITETQ